MCGQIFLSLKIYSHISLQTNFIQIFIKYLHCFAQAHIVCEYTAVARGAPVPSRTLDYIVVQKPNSTDLNVT